MKGQAGRIAATIGIFIAIIVVASIALGSFAFVSAGHRGVLLTFGAVEDRILPEGMSFVTPFVNQVIPMSVQTNKYSVSGFGIGCLKRLAGSLYRGNAELQDK